MCSRAEDKPGLNFGLTLWTASGWSFVFPNIASVFSSSPLSPYITEIPGYYFLVNHLLVHCSLGQALCVIGNTRSTLRREPVSGCTCLTGSLPNNLKKSNPLLHQRSMTNVTDFIINHQSIIHPCLMAK